MLSGPEIARIIEEYNTQEEAVDDRHHEDNASFNTKFSVHVKALLAVLENQDIFSSNDLTSIGNDRRVLSQTINDRVLQAPTTASTLYNDYIKEVILDSTKSIHDRIKQNHFSIFRVTSEKKEISKEKIKLQQAKTYAYDICKMFIAHENRGGDSREFFKHENNKFPPSISEFGDIRHTSDDEALIKLLEKKLPTDQTLSAISSTCLIIDGEELWSKFASVKCKTFLEFSTTVNKYIESLTMKYSRIDLVFGSYSETSNQDPASFLLVDDGASFPKNFVKFLSNDCHKKQLSAYLAKKLTLNFKESSYQVIVAAAEHAYKNNDAIDVGGISPCNHTDSASRVVLHAKDSSKTHWSICIQTSKVLSVVLGLYAFGSAFSGLTSEHELFIQFASKKKERIIPIHQIYNQFADIAEILIYFHTFTGCETVSSFYSIGKTKAFNTWMKYRQADAAFKALIETKTPNIDEKVLEIIQRFVVLMYDSKSNSTLVNDFRWLLFKKNTSIERIPPTLDALQQHIKRACLQSKIYYQCIQKEIISDDRLEWGWQQNEENRLEPLWITIPISSEHKNLTSCKCTDNCKKKCKCEQKCTKLCDCEGFCQRTEIKRL